MFSSLRHQFKHTLPLLGLTGLIVGVMELVRTVRHLSSAEGSAGLLGALGEGIDEFGIRTGTLSHQLLDFTTDANGWMAAAAIAATAVTVVSAFRSLAEWIRGPGDAVAFVQHAAQRAAGTLGTRATPVSWGRVYDAQSQQPLPFARVSVMDDAGRVVARSVADINGAFGFAQPLHDVAGRGGVGGLSVRKSGYRVHERRFPVLAGDIAHTADVSLVKLVAGDTSAPVRRSSVARAVSTAAFWGGVLTVPMVYFTEPGTAGTLLVALFGVSAIVRAVGSGSRS